MKIIRISYFPPFFFDDDGFNEAFLFGVGGFRTDPDDADEPDDFIGWSAVDSNSSSLATDTEKYSRTFFFSINYNVFNNKHWWLIPWDDAYWGWFEAVDSKSLLTCDPWKIEHILFNECLLLIKWWLILWDEEERRRLEPVDRKFLAPLTRDPKLTIVVSEYL